MRTLSTTMGLLLCACLCAQVEPHPKDENAPPPHVLVPYKDVATGLHGFAARDGRSIPARYEDAAWFSNGFASVRSNGLWGLIDTTGRQVLAPLYRDVWPVEEGTTICFKPGSSDPCLVHVPGSAVCVPFNAYFAAWKTELRASTIQDKELVIRVLEMQGAPEPILREMKGLEATYVAIAAVRAAATRRLLAAR